MRGYDAWVTREPYWFDDPPLFPDVRCIVCGCWIGYSHKLTPIKIDTDVRVERCEGIWHPPAGKWYHDQCTKTSSDHEPHDVGAYYGTTTWFHCNHCGADSPVQEY